jgi:hypothetical protein
LCEGLLQFLGYCYRVFHSLLRQLRQRSRGLAHGGDGSCREDGMLGSIFSFSSGLLCILLAVADQAISFLCFLRICTCLYYVSVSLTYKYK